MTSETLAALVSTLAFMFLLLPIFYIWIPYEIISSKYVYSFNIGTLKYLGICFIVLGIVVGLSMGNVLRSAGLDAIVVLALFLMLYPAMLDVDFSGISRVIVEPSLVVSELVLNFLVSPLLIYGIAYMLLRASNTSLLIGVTLYSIVPCGGMVPAFTAMVKGNGSLSVTITTISLILSLGFVPLWTKIMIGNQMLLPALLILKHLFVIIVISLIVAVLIRRIITARKGETAFSWVKECIKILSRVGLMMLMFAMSAPHQPTMGSSNLPTRNNEEPKKSAELWIKSWNWC